jgi:hypothetical protein
LLVQAKPRLAQVPPLPATEQRPHETAIGQAFRALDAVYFSEKLRGDPHFSRSCPENTELV